MRYPTVYSTSLVTSFLLFSSLHFSANFDLQRMMTKVALSCFFWPHCIVIPFGRLYGSGVGLWWLNSSHVPRRVDASASIHVALRRTHMHILHVHVLYVYVYQRCVLQCAGCRYMVHARHTTGMTFVHARSPLLMQQQKTAKRYACAKFRHQ